MVVIIIVIVVIIIDYSSNYHGIIHNWNAVNYTYWFFSENEKNTDLNISFYYNFFIFFRKKHYREASESLESAYTV